MTVYKRPTASILIYSIQKKIFYIMAFIKLDSVYVWLLCVWKEKHKCLSLQLSSVWMYRNHLFLGRKVKKRIERNRQQKNGGLIVKNIPEPNPFKFPKVQEFLNSVICEKKQIGWAGPSFRHHNLKFMVWATTKKPWYGLPYRLTFALCSSSSTDALK